MDWQRLYYSTFGGVRKNLHFPYYVHGFAMLAIPRQLKESQREQVLRSFDRLSSEAQENVLRRVNYYCQLELPVSLPEQATTIGDHTYRNKRCPSVYFFDSYEWLRYFPKDLRWMFAPGDVAHTFDTPTIAKSRPIGQPLTFNTTLLNMDKVRHFMFFRDPIPLQAKKTQVFFRGAITGKPQRAHFFEIFYDHPLFDLKDTARDSTYPEAQRQRHETIIYDHLHYRYIMSLQGNDVASNLKWIMNSNSIAVAPKMTTESWFMEGTLKPNEHYIEIQQDFSDIEERIAYYNDHPTEAQDIVDNAHAYCRQFQDARTEKLVSLMTLDKYFRMTNEA